MNLLGFLILTVVLYLVLSGSRSRAAIGMVAGILYLTQNQQFNVAGFNIFTFRIVELAGFLRVVTRREFAFSYLTRIDKALIIFIIYTVVVFIVRGGDGIAYRIGWGTDAFLCYFSFRGLIQNRDDIYQLLKSTALLIIPFAILSLIESIYKFNIFSLIGARSGGSDMIRGDRLRAIGSFRHPSLMGTFGACMLPTYIAFIRNQSIRNSGILGTIACLMIVYASNSGGPLSCVGVAFVGWIFWILRSQLRAVKIIAFLLLVIVGSLMKAPIWYIPAKISSISGGDGWHRSHLMEQAFKHIESWWLAGMPTVETQTWFAYYIHATGSADITNQYISYGIAAGLGSMILFFLLLIKSFNSLGTALNKFPESDNMPIHDQHLGWALGVTIVVHMFNWIGISYFDQTYGVWYMQLALISAFQLPATARPN
ncbi:hypothetical protein ESB00_14475 [Oleiharenicola lentus]|uniref:O-antigen ligase domain-containing protein n=1 Tax=Oleiharenicola lentus TaxID=2508720 RepID=A0A4Q1C3E6_9BACT|nr:hypothetical protein [Oleiharenicola lentus]RXK52914.1 hypothetical protein ESB00_14475 [Oleiharenicola lentus]